MKETLYRPHAADGTHYCENKDLDGWIKGSTLDDESNKVHGTLAWSLSMLIWMEIVQMLQSHWEVQRSFPLCSLHGTIEIKSLLGSMIQLFFH